MNPVQLILKKRNGREHTPEEIKWLIRELIEGRLESYQLAAWLMAVWFRGMSEGETEWLTQAMVESGDQVDLSDIDGIKVDKHSTGGVGDGTTLLVAPIVAAAGGKVAKMSGRGLGHTGGTLDKLESIPGMRVNLGQDEFIRQVQRIGLAVISQTGKLVPADGQMYALRDVTGTVDSIPLIAASIMSKKLACGADAILLDTKFGHGAFMKNLDDARELARCMVTIGKRRGRKVRAALSSMEEPLGSQIGNALEVDECLQVLRNEKPRAQICEVAYRLAAQLLVMADLATSDEEAMQKVQDIVEKGIALERLAKMIEAQGGDPRVTENRSLLPQARERIELKADRAGWVTGILAEDVGTAAMLLGAGRVKKTDPIDPAVGVVLHVETGSPVEAGQPIVTLHVNNAERVGEVERLMRNAVSIGPEKPPEQPLIKEFVS